ncbi:MAG: diguanylate cyclase [Actinomycetia bacterium]|nr:diguanylate cyclase [Actinomycetes bacterium]
MDSRTSLAPTWDTGTQDMVATSSGRIARQARVDALLVVLLAVVLGALATTTVLKEGPSAQAWALAAVVVVAPTLAVHLLLTWNRARVGAVEVALGRAEERMRLLFHSSPEPMWVYDQESLAVVDVNPAAVQAYGWRRDEFLRLSLVDIVDTGTDELRSVMGSLPEPTTFLGEWRHRRKDGSTRWVLVTTQAVEHGGRSARLSVAHDVTAQHEHEARTRAILDHAPDAILTIDLDGLVESLNPAAERMFGHRGDTVVGTDVGRLMEPSADESTLPVGTVQVRTRAGLQLGREVTGRRADGTTFPLELSVTEVELGDRTICTLVARDVTERKAFERRLTHQGTHDALTGLPNRVLFMDRLAHALATARRSRRPMAVLFCDIDRFKVINDSLGHTAGDALLFAVAGRFRSALRAGDTVARFGGDEFVILAEDLADEADAVIVAEKLAEALREPIAIGTQEIVVSSSVGIAVADPETATPETLVRDADVAMYRAKANGRARHVQFDADLRRQAIQRMDTESALRRGMGLQEFVVHYQPEVNITSGKVEGVEALVRWDHPDHGLTVPANFLPVAEETGLIVAIGETVFHQACLQAARWHEQFGVDAPTMWVNVSARQLASPMLVEVVRTAVESFLPAPACLGLEITETDIVPDDDLSRKTMEDLTDLGVRIAIDDFGTGFASLSYLWRFPAQVVKIDRSFVRRLDEEREATVLVAAMIQLAHSLGKTTVAEGVETEEQLARLRSLGCDAVQGYLLGRPAPADQIQLLLG